MNQPLEKSPMKPPKNSRRLLKQMTLRQGEVLVAAHYGEIAVEQITPPGKFRSVRVAKYDGKSVSSTVKRLQERGFVKYVVVPLDFRSRYMNPNSVMCGLFLTAEGLKALQAMGEPWNE